MLHECSPPSSLHDPGIPRVDLQLETRRVGGKHPPPAAPCARYTSTLLRPRAPLQCCCSLQFGLSDEAGTDKRRVPLALQQLFARMKLSNKARVPYVCGFGPTESRRLLVTERSCRGGDMICHMHAHGGGWVGGGVAGECFHKVLHR